jgi:AraC-like DNA-binding protein
VKYREQHAPAPLDEFVECVWFLTSTVEDRCSAPAEQRILPDGCVELICHFGSRFNEISRAGLRSPQPCCFVVGMLTAPFVVQPSGDAETMGIRFRPGCAYLFFPQPLDALTNRVVDLDDMWGTAARDLWEQLADAPDDSAHVDRMSSALLARLARATSDPVTASAVSDLVRSAGRASISLIAARIGVTPRHLQRRFGQRIGVPPKLLARILRFQNTLRQRAPAPDGRTDWVRVAVHCGYSDQSHLIRDYAAFAGETPGSLMAAEGELSSYFTAPQRLAALFERRS